jgi:hypothetical protein
MLTSVGKDEKWVNAEEASLNRQVLAGQDRKCVFYSYIVYVEEFYSIILIFARPYNNDVGLEMKVEESKFRH